MNKQGWLINDCLTCIPGTKTFWHYLLEWIPDLQDKTGGYTNYSVLPQIIETSINKCRPDYLIRNGTYFRRINTDIKTISLIQDVIIHNGQPDNNQIDVINNSNHVVFNTMYVYQKYKTFITHNNLSIIPLGVDFDFFTPIVNRHQDVLTNSIIYIGSSLDYPKGFNRVLNIINTMHEQNFCLVMKDNYTITQLPIEVRNRVKIFNRVDQETVRLLINSCVCAVCTSYEETQHLSGIECGACNIPIVATSVGIYNDCQNDSNWGCIADDSNFKSKLEYVIQHKELFTPRKYFIEKGYSTDSCKQSWTQLLLNL